LAPPPGGRAPPPAARSAAAHQAAEAAARAAEAERLQRAGRVEAAAAGDALELLGGDLLGLRERLVDRGQDEVLEHLDVLGVDGLGVELDLLQAHVAGRRRP
jgi:hypothetical protein